MRVFVDTSAFFAIMVRNDYMHVRARETFKRLLEGAAELYTTSYVVLETIALLQARVGLDAARSFQHEFLSIFKVCWVDQNLHEKSFRRLELRGRREISLVDCASFVWMEESGDSYAFAYDEHFAAEGFTLLQVPEDIE